MMMIETFITINVIYTDYRVVCLVSWQLNHRPTFMNRLVLKEQQKHISTFKPDFTFPATCVDRTPSVQANVGWTLCSLLCTMWTDFEMFCVSYATWQEMCFWNVIMGLTANHSVNVCFSLLVCICCCWMIVNASLALLFWADPPFVMHFFQHYISFIIYSAVSS